MWNIYNINNKIKILLLRNYDFQYNNFKFIYKRLLLITTTPPVIGIRNNINIQTFTLILIYSHTGRHQDHHEYQYIYE